MNIPSENPGYRIAVKDGNTELTEYLNGIIAQLNAENAIEQFVVDINIMKQNLEAQVESQTGQLELTESLYREIENIETTVQQVIEKIKA